MLFSVSGQLQWMVGYILQYEWWAAACTGLQDCRCRFLHSITAARCWYDASHPRRAIDTNFLAAAGPGCGAGENARDDLLSLIIKSSHPATDYEVRSANDQPGHWPPPSLLSPWTEMKQPNNFPSPITMSNKYRLDKAEYVWLSIWTFLICQVKDKSCN